jgi:hypothetical protein
MMRSGVAGMALRVFGTVNLVLDGVRMIVARRARTLGRSWIATGIEQRGAITNAM